MCRSAAQIAERPFGLGRDMKPSPLHWE
jgi:hypothetical protein